MKNYIGTKRIEAEPMTRGDYNKYRGWTIPADKNPEDEGYIVKYSNDYISWSPKQAFEEAYSEIGENPLYDTALLMKSNDFKDRFRAEYYQLKIRYKKLDVMLYKMENGDLDFRPKCSYELLRTQCITMKAYLLLLQDRAKIEGIEL